MGTIKRFEDLKIWELAREIANDVFLISNDGEFSKDSSLKDQIRRSTGSVMDNIAEGFDRDGRREFIHFLSIAKGSASEIKSQLYRALDRNYISQETFDNVKNKLEEQTKMIGGFMNYLRQSDYKGNKFREGEMIYKKVEE